MISDISLHANTTLVLNFSSSLHFDSTTTVNISLFESGSVTRLNASLHSTSIELTNLPSIPHDSIFALHIYNVTLPRSVGTIGIINISSYNTTYSLTNMILSATAKIQPTLPNQIEIRKISIGEQRADALLPIIFNLSLSSSFIPFSDYLEFIYPPEVHWDNSKSYFSSQSSLIPYFVASYPQNRTVRTTLKAGIGPNDSFEITLLIYSNNSKGQLGAFKIAFYDQTNHIIAQSPTVYPASWNSPTSFQNVMFILSNPRVANLTNCTFKVPLSLEVPIGGSLIVIFPSELQTASSLCVVTSNAEYFNCTNLRNGTFVATSDSAPMLASTQVEILVINATTPLIPGPTVFDFSFETWSAGNEFVLQKGEQYYNITLEEDSANLIVSTSFSGSSNWFPLLSIYCITVVVLSILHHIIKKKYHILPLIVSFWSIAEFPCLVYSIYYFMRLELPANIGYDFPTTIVVIVAIILTIGIIVHLKGLLSFKKHLNSISRSKSANRTLKLLWICSGFTNKKLLWLLFRESYLKSYRTMRDKKDSLILMGSKHRFDISMNIIWLSICGVFALSKAIIDAVYQRNGYYFLFEAAAFYLVSAVLNLFFYRMLKGQSLDTYLASCHNVEEYVQQKSVDNSPMQRDQELSPSRHFEVNQEVEIPHPLSGSRIMIDVPYINAFIFS